MTLDSEIQAFIRMVLDAWTDAGSPRVKLTSWYRTPAHNRAVGGDPRSQHLLALAIDILPDAGGTRLASAARAAGLTVVYEGDHYHVQRYARGKTPGTLWA